MKDLEGHTREMSQLTPRGWVVLASSQLTVPLVGSRTILCYWICVILLLSSKSTGVTHWKLQDDAIAPASPDLESHQQEEYYVASIQTNDPEFAVLLRHSTTRGVSRPRGSHHRGSSCPVIVDLNSQPAQPMDRCSELPATAAAPRNPDGSGPMSPSELVGAQPGPLNCGEMVEFTVYDFLKGIARREEHKSYPEPEVAMIFKKSETDSSIDLFEVEMGLRKAYQENPESLTVLNQIGNFWRIKGNTQVAIECFRKALAFSPDHPDLLLNLARVLFNLKYYDDAVFLAKRSLHMKSSDQHAWLQYFTLGEVYKALEKYEEAAFYFRKSLELNPGLQVAEMHLRELGLDQQYSVNAYTLLIIFVLICIVLVVIYYLIVAVSSNSSGVQKCVKVS